MKIEDVKEYLTSTQIESLLQIYPSGEFRCWGVTPSKINVSKWNRIQPGDVTLFARQGRIFGRATTTIKFHNQNLATHLWKTNKEGATWEYMYFLDEVDDLDVPYSEFNKIIGYEPNYVIQGFNVLPFEKARKVFDSLGLWSDTFYPEASKEDYANAVLELEETDATTHSNVRLEQGYLRRFLFGNKVTEQCACCGDDFPVSMLVTAHIKPRKHCSREEKLDQNVVIPMCKFGCDELFERGAIVVNDGNIENGKVLASTPVVDSRINILMRRQIRGFNTSNRAYFEWHRMSHLKRDST